MYVPEPTEATRDAVLEVAAQALWRRDEGSLRIADICQSTNLSSSVIYNNFRSRQGLIDAAYLSIYESMTTEIVAVFDEVSPRLLTFADRILRMEDGRIIADERPVASEGPTNPPLEVVQHDH